MNDDAAVGPDPWSDVAPADPVADQTARDTEFSLFYETEVPRLVAFLAHHGSPLSLAADIAQEAMLEAYQFWDSLYAPRAWVRKVAVRRWWAVNGQHRSEQLHAEPPEPSGLLDSDEATRIEQRHEVLARLRRLPPAQREVMAWTYDGYRPTEIADLLGKEPATVRSALRQARATLQAETESG